MKPIIFIPGIEATKLVDANSFDFDTVWNAFDTVGTALGTKVTGPYLDERLQLEPLYDETPEVIVERNHMARLPYEKSLLNIKSKINEGKKVTDPLFLFGYDWRLSCQENAKRLQVFVGYLQQKLAAAGSVDGFRFITHSMGGLVMSAYLALPGLKYDHIDKIILCAPPFRGSPYSLVHMIKGDGGFKSFLNRVLGRNDDIRKVVRTYPSIYELLPYYEKAITYTDDNSESDLLRRDNWQSNVYDDIVPLFDARLRALAQFRKEQQADLSQLPVELRQRMVVIAGTGDKTVTFVKADKQRGDTKNFLRLDLLNTDDCLQSGDGTVPEVSATWFKNSVRTLAVKKENFFDELSNNVDFHGLLLRDSRVQNIIIRFLLTTGNAANAGDGNDLASLRGKNANMWYSIGGTVENLSPF